LLSGEVYFIDEWYFKLLLPGT